MWAAYLHPIPLLSVIQEVDIDSVRIILARDLCKRSKGAPSLSMPGMKKLRSAS